MDEKRPVVFIGSGEASVLERKTLQYSLVKNSRVRGSVRARFPHLARASMSQPLPLIIACLPALSTGGS